MVAGAVVDVGALNAVGVGVDVGVEIEAAAEGVVEVEVEVEVVVMFPVPLATLFQVEVVSGFVTAKKVP